MEAGHAWLDKGEPLEKQDYKDQVAHMSFLLLKEVQMKGTLKCSLWKLLWPGGLIRLIPENQPRALGGLP